MPPQGVDPVDDIWFTMFRKAPIIGGCTLLGLLGSILAIFFFVDSGPFRILAVPYISMPMFMVIGFIVGVIVDSIYGLIFRRGGKKKKKRWKPPGERFHDED